MSSSARIPAPRGGDDHARLPCIGTTPPAGRPRAVTAASVRSTPDEYVIGPFSGPRSM